MILQVLLYRTFFMILLSSVRIGEELWTSRLLSYLFLLRHLRFPLHCVNSLTSNTEFKLSYGLRSQG
jgi:hypothetical protein